MSMSAFLNLLCMTDGSLTLRAGALVLVASPAAVGDAHSLIRSGGVEVRPLDRAFSGFSTRTAYTRSTRRWCVCSWNRGICREERRVVQPRSSPVLFQRVV